MSVYIGKVRKCKEESSRLRVPRLLSIPIESLLSRLQRAVQPPTRDQQFRNSEADKRRVQTEHYDRFGKGEEQKKLTFDQLDSPTRRRTRFLRSSLGKENMNRSFSGLTDFEEVISCPATCLA